MSTPHENLKNIPILKEKSTIAKFTTKTRVIKSVAKRNQCAMFFELGKHNSLPLLETALSGVSHTADQDIAVDKHGLAVQILTIAYQNDTKLSSFITKTESVQWPTREMDQIMLKIEKHYKMTMNTGNKLKHEIAKEELLDAIQWKRKTNPEDVWSAMSAVGLQYHQTCPVTDNDQIKWVTKHAPSGYDGRIVMAPMKLKSEQQDQSYVMTFDDLTNERNEQYSTFQRSTKKKAELSLLNAAANAASQSNGGGNQSRKKNGNKGGRGGGRGGGMRSTDPNKRTCYYCGRTGHTKYDCPKFKKERDKLFCGHCDTNGHDEGTCFKLKPELKQMSDGIRKLNKFGKGEFAGALVDDGKSNKGDGYVELNLACINCEDAKDKDDEWCRVCFDTDGEDKQHRNIVVNIDITNDVYEGIKLINIINMII